MLNHYPDAKKSRGSYLPLLEMAVEEDPLGDRVRYYLGREYMYKGLWRQCIDTLKRHLELPTARWNEERGASMRWIAKSFFELGDYRQAYAWYYRAIAEAGHMRDAYVEFARVAYRRGDWPVCFCMAEQALRIAERSKTYVNMGYAWDHTPDDLAAIACYRLGMLERSLAHAEKALAINPGDARLQENRRLIMAEIKKKAGL